MIDFSKAQEEKDSLAMKDAKWEDLNGNVMPDMPGPPLPEFQPPEGI